ncbi:uncharacterized protein TM35_000221930 [Trypanosoma theileri]|uniref:CNNM transmembrane domain-containing protein n=1 Tax=Trypanosoma theileri TaxID=67003 RepID=A0A1X0NRR8_9TRYP|nr:uncharacterized protein TM35_000221930 [Trypanosoma theileri]ORC87394.1 hypothetical protein TM35_000221930 [Trypanosoma theileri]
MTNSSFFGFDIDVPDAVKGGVIVCLTILAGLSSGLLLCLFSLDTNRLNALMQGSNTEDARRARRVMMLLHKPNWLLVTLILLEDVAVEMMPLVFDLFLNPIAAIFVSVGIILVFGEIIPQAIFVRYALQVSAAMAYVVLFMMCLTSPITWPIGKLLDIILGDKEKVFWGRSELKELVRLQEELQNEKCGEDIITSSQNEQSSLMPHDQDISPLEASIILGALSMSESTALDVLKQDLNSVYCLHRDTLVTKEITKTIFLKGLRFIAVYNDVDDSTSVTHVLETKVLICFVYRKEKESVRLCDLPLRPLCCFPETTLCSELFESLHHMVGQVAAVVGGEGKIIGIVTMRDVVEFIHRTSFKGEMDPKADAPLQMANSWRRLREVCEESNRSVFLRANGVMPLRHTWTAGGEKDSHTSSCHSTHSNSPLLRPNSSQNASLC